MSRIKTIGILLAVAIVGYAMYAYAVQLSPLIQAPKAVLTAGYDPDDGTVKAVRLNAGGQVDAGGLVSVLYVRDRDSASLYQVQGGDAVLDTIGNNVTAAAVAPYVWNTVAGLTRAQDAGGSGDDRTAGIPATGGYVSDGVNWDRARSSAVGDAQTVGIPAGAGYGYNGASWDRLRATIGYGLSVDPTRLPYVQADNTANPANKLPVLGAVATATAPAWAEGRIVPLSTSLSGGLRTIATITPTTYLYKNMYSTDNVAVVKSGAGTLHTISLNTSASLETIVWTVYDNTSAAGTKIATIQVPESWPNTLTYDVEFTTGLTIQASPLGGGASNITVSYK